jgi:glycosyltransferase involved in cell wall biosynthesis
MDVATPALLTVVIPTYNRKDLLTKAVRSVTDQRIPNLIIHIYDNCSTDGTDVIVRKLMGEHQNIVYTRRESNLGSLVNYSDAIRSVKTPFLMSLADDDWFLEGGIQKLLDAILGDESLGAVVSQTIHQNENGDHLRINPGDDWEYRRYTPEEFIPLWVERGHFEWSSIIFRREALEVAGVPDISTDLVWDVDLQLQIFFRYPVKLIRQISTVFLVHSEQSSRNITLPKFAGQLAMLRRAKKLAGSNYPTQSGSMVKFVDKWTVVLASEAAFHKNTNYFVLSVLENVSGSSTNWILSKYTLQWINLKIRIVKHKCNLRFPRRIP